MPQNIVLNESQTQAIQEDSRRKTQEIIAAARKAVDSNKAFVFFAAFDGTNNDKDDLGGDFQSTNVGQLWDQYNVVTQGNDNLGGGYYAGLGTRGRPKAETWVPEAVTRQAQRIARDAHNHFMDQATDWLEDHPGGELTAVVTAFSRGAASAAIFSQLLCRDGLKSPAGANQARKAGVAAGVLFDPVATGFDGNLAFPPNVNNLVVIKALNEYRQDFMAVDYSNQKDIVATIGMYGNHCDIGGGYDNGLGALSLEAATAFLQKAGLPVADVPAVRQFNPTDVFVHTEEFDDFGRKKWSVYLEDGFNLKDLRRYDKKIEVVPASRSAPSGSLNFLMYDGTSIAV